MSPPSMQFYTKEENITRETSCSEKPYKKRRVDQSPPAITRPQEIRVEGPSSSEQPESARSSLRLSHFIHTTCALYIASLVHFFFRWKPRTRLNQDTTLMQPQLEQTSASPDISTKQRSLSPPPSQAPDQETDSAQDWRLQMLIERRKREAERASHNRKIVVTFAGPAHLDIEFKSQTDLEVNFQADEEPLPFVPSSPASLVRIYYPIPIKRQASALFQCPASRCPSPSPSDTAWEDSEAASISSRFTRCSLPPGNEEDTTNSDSEEEELQHVMSMIFDEED